MTIIENIDRLRLERGWSVNYLAMEAMLTQSTVNNLYARESEPKISTLRAICNAFGITLSEFFRECEENGESDSNDELLCRINKLNKEEKLALLILLRRLG